MYEKDNPASVQQLFSSIAKRYDTTNLLMSMGLNKYWNRKLIQHSLQKANKGALLDLCCGTGEITYTYLKGCSAPKKVHMVDFCNDMLDVARERAENLGLKQKHKLRFIEADAQRLPLKESSVSAVSVAYGIRNVKDPNKCIQEAYRVLEEGGIFGILELTRPSNGVMRWMHRVYLKAMIPLFGALCTSNREAYDYLKDTVNSFIEPGQLAKLMSQAGFVEVSVIPLTFGAANIIVGKKR